MTIRRILALVFALALVVTACGDDDSDTSGRYSDAIRSSYLAGCEAESPGGNFCECTLEEIEKTFTEAEFIAFAIEATEEPPEEFLAVAFACLGELDIDE